MKRISRRSFVQGSAVAMLAQGVGIREAEAAGRGELVLVGTGTSGPDGGVFGFTLDPATGEMTLRGLAAAAQKPSFLAISPNKRFVFAVEEVGQMLGAHSGGLMSFAFDEGTGSLTKVSEVLSAGTGPCHVATDHTGRCVFVANYSGGSAASYTVSPKGELSEAVTRLAYEGHGPDKRQEASHAHRATVSPGNGFVMINDLGLDRIHVYKLNAMTAELTANDPPEWRSKAGAGPRALRLHPNGTTAYCLCELSSTVYVLRWDENAGTLTTVQEIALDPTKATTSAAEIVITKAATFAYASNRGDNTLTTFSVAADGRLTFVAKSPCGGKTPRHIALDPTERWLLAMNQGSNTIVVFARDMKTGRLAETGKSFAQESPQCALFV